MEEVIERGVTDFWRCFTGNSGGFLGVPPRCIRIDAMQAFDRISWNPAQMNGQPCVRGIRLTVRRVVEAVALYPNRNDLFRNYPELEPEDIQQALAFAAANLEDRATGPGAEILIRTVFRSDV